MSRYATSGRARSMRASPTSSAGSPTSSADSTRWSAGHRRQPDRPGAGSRDRSPRPADPRPSRRLADLERRLRRAGAAGSADGPSRLDRRRPRPVRAGRRLRPAASLARRPSRREPRHGHDHGDGDPDLPLCRPAQMPTMKEYDPRRVRSDRRTARRGSPLHKGLARMRLQIGKASCVALLAAGLVAVYWGPARAPARRTGPLRSGIAKTGFDAKVRPQDDLFRHVNGGWLAEAKIPAEYGCFGTLHAAPRQGASGPPGDHRGGRPARTTRRPAPRPARSATCTPASWTRRRSRSSGSSRSRATSPGSTRSRTRRASSALLAELQREGVGGLFRLFVDHRRQAVGPLDRLPLQGGISLPDESYYRDAEVQADPRGVRRPRRRRCSSWPACPSPAEAAEQVMALETRLAKDHWDRVKSRDQTLTYNKKDRKALDALTPGFDWAAWFDAHRAPRTDRRGRRPPARLLHRDGQGARRRPARRLEDLARLARARRRRAAT